MLRPSTPGRQSLITCSRNSHTCIAEKKQPLRKVTRGGTRSEARSQHPECEKVGRSTHTGNTSTFNPHMPGRYRARKWGASRRETRRTPKGRDPENSYRRRRKVIQTRGMTARPLSPATEAFNDYPLFDLAHLRWNPRRANQSAAPATPKTRKTKQSSETRLRRNVAGNQQIQTLLRDILPPEIQYAPCGINRVSGGWPRRRREASKRGAAQFNGSLDCGFPAPRC